MPSKQNTSKLYLGMSLGKAPNGVGGTLTARKQRFWSMQKQQVHVLLCDKVKPGARNKTGLKRWAHSDTSQASVQQLWAGLTSQAPPAPRPTYVGLCGCSRLPWKDWAVIAARYSVGAFRCNHACLAPSKAFKKRQTVWIRGNQLWSQWEVNIIKGGASTIGTRPQGAAFEFLWKLTDSIFFSCDCQEFE